ncbi:hypothetical protein KKC04_04790 [Patescibacteria group bacterium]|nr:hypothetical protein [Patescibacteria group bacterium]
MKVYNPDEGLERIMELSEKCNQRPVLIAVIGLPNSGKTFLRERAKEKFHKKNIGGTSSYDHGYHYEFSSAYDYFFIHATCSNPKEVSSFTQQSLGRDVNIAVYIYNPFVETPNVDELEEYDVTIENSGARRK